MKKLVTFLMLLFAAACTLYADEEIEFSALSVSGGAVSPGQQDLVLLELRLENEGESPYFFTGLTLRYTGTDPADIAVSSVKLYGSWGRDAWVQYGSNQSFSGTSCVFSGIGMLIPSEGTRYIRITADCAPGAPSGHVIDADIGSLADLTVTAPFQSGDAPFHSLSRPYTVESRAVGMSITGIPSSVVAGQSFSFTVSYVDSTGAVDPAAAGGEFSIGGTPGSEPGIAPAGQAPQYLGGSVASGQRTCTATLFRAETGRSITVSDSLYGSARSPDITVTASSPARITMDPIAGQTAGVPFFVAINTADTYGNPSSSGAGLVTIVEAASGIEPSPGGQSDNLPVSHAWSGGEGGRATVSVVIYGRSAGAQLRATDSVMGSSVSNTFVVSPGAAVGYALQADPSIRLLTPVTITASVLDAWGNTGGSYAGRALIQCTDNRAEIPSSTAFTGGIAHVTALFRTGGAQTVTLTDQSNASLTGSLTMNVDRPPAPSLFAITVPEVIEAGKPFRCSIAALDGDRRVIREYNAPVNLTTEEGATVVPPSVLLSSGAWQGTIAVWGESFTATLCVSDGDVRSVSRDTMRVILAGYEKTRVYPTVFSPRDRALHIRYYLKEDRDVTITVYNLLMEPVREFRFSAGSSGGRLGLNVVEWDGRDGNNDRAHSGGYHIIVDKGYEKNSAGAVIKNY